MANLKRLAARGWAFLRWFWMWGDSAHPRLHAGAVITCCLWFGLHGPLRRFAIWLGASADGFLAVAPSFFAGCFATVVTFMALPRPIPAAVCGAAFALATEIIQPWMRQHTYDLGDIVAGAIGATLVVPLLWWHKRSISN